MSLYYFAVEYIIQQLPSKEFKGILQIFFYLMANFFYKHAGSHLHCFSDLETKVRNSFFSLKIMKLFTKDFNPELKIFCKKKKARVLFIKLCAVFKSSEWRTL